MRAHEYRVTQHADAPLEVVLAVLDDVPRWHEWVGPLHHSGWEREGDPAPHGVGAIRRFGPRFGRPSREEITEYRPSGHVAYRSLSGGLPTHGYAARVDLTPEGDGTRITWRGDYRTAVPGVPAVVRTIIRGFARRLAREAARRSRAGTAP